MGKNKNLLFWTALTAGLLLVTAGTVLGFGIWKNTKQARAAAAEFTERLAAGELTVVQMKYYVREVDGGDSAVTGAATGPGVSMAETETSASVSFITPQELMACYGEELVMAGREEEVKDRDNFFALVMKYSALEQKVGLTPGKKTNAVITLTGPDLKNWLDELPAEELNRMLQAEDVIEWLELHLAAGDVPERTLRFRIPMRKVYGSWYFEVTPEMESAFFGGL